MTLGHQNRPRCAWQPWRRMARAPQAACAGVASRRRCAGDSCQTRPPRRRHSRTAAAMTAMMMARAEPRRKRWRLRAHLRAPRLRQRLRFLQPARVASQRPLRRRPQGRARLRQRNRPETHQRHRHALRHARVLPHQFQKRTIRDHQHAPTRDQSHRPQRPIQLLERLDQRRP